MSWDILSLKGALLAENLATSWVLLAADKKPQGPVIPTWVLPVAIGLAFYLIMLRPQSRERSQMSNLLNNLKQNDKVVTIGGIHGTIVAAPKESDTVVIRIDENCKLRIARSAIARLVEPNDKKGKDKLEK